MRVLFLRIAAFNVTAACIPVFYYPVAAQQYLYYLDPQGRMLTEVSPKLVKDSCTSTGRLVANNTSVNKI